MSRSGSNFTISSNLDTEVGKAVIDTGNEEVNLEDLE